MGDYLRKKKNALNREIICIERRFVEQESSILMSVFEEYSILRLFKIDI